MEDKCTIVGRHQQMDEQQSVRLQRMLEIHCHQPSMWLNDWYFSHSKHKFFKENVWLLTGVRHTESTKETHVKKKRKFFLSGFFFLHHLFCYRFLPQTSYFRNTYLFSNIVYASSSIAFSLNFLKVLVLLNFMRWNSLFVSSCILSR